MSKLSLEDARSIVRAALDHAATIDAKPLTVAVLDDGGHLVMLERQDGASALRPEVAQAKAATAINLGKSSRAIAEDAAARPTFVSALSALAGGRVLPAAGGFAFRNTKGDVAGAIGITGDTSDRDEECAIAGAKAAGFSPDL
ncbi:hypothetical protein JCM17846_18720 [Iodidimonas nitroreducens]|uniref:GlcG protein n=1 Tax=Iodidimonas nitroreducens TaxID=1236968 RepID=A0A5A7N9R6_9PROT|nr:heme-binding protein [Iodidimonas nitroreducens]GER04190.1 hypothetical protein JCM17846_18720 [Iodidimonas nitroreducens]